MDDYQRFKQDFLSGKLKGCKTFFVRNHYYTEAAYSFIMLDNLDKAQEYFEKARSSDIRAKWGTFLVQMLKNDIRSYPTYFQIRNFLEIDLNLLLLYGKGEYAEKLIKYADFMAYYNPECYKFIGRAFWANKFIPAAMFFLKRAKDKFYKDPELHYLLAYIYYTEENNIELCKKSLNTCLEILPEYNPAKKLLQSIN